MRHDILPWLALAAICLPSCNHDRPAAEPRPVAVVTAALEGGACTFRWNGAPVSREMLLRNSANMLIEAFNRDSEEQRRSEERGGPREAGPEDGPDFADFRLEAVRSLPFSCFGPALRIAQLSGFGQATLRVAGERLPDQRVFFEFDLPGPKPPYSAIVRIDAAGRTTWNGEPIDLNGLLERVRAMGGQRADAVAVSPSDGADMMTLYEALRAIGQVMTMPTLSGCAARSGPPGGSQAC